MRLGVSLLRAGLCLALLGWMLFSGVKCVRAEESPRVVTLDWTLAETLVALDAPPVGVGQRAAYHEWVGEPRLPDDVRDVGFRSQPNVELIAALRPDLILLSPMFANLEPRLSRIVPVENLSLYEPDGETWQRMQSLTREIGTLVGREPEAEALIARAKSEIELLRDCVANHDEPLVMVQFMDDRHVRVFGENGLYQAVLEQLGLRNAWPGETNRWGFSLVDIHALTALQGTMVVIRPYPVGAREKLRDSPLWQMQPSVREGSMIALDPVWSFGALPSAMRFARLLAEALSEHCRVME